MPLFRKRQQSTPTPAPAPSPPSTLSKTTTTARSDSKRSDIDILSDSASVRTKTSRFSRSSSRRSSRIKASDLPFLQESGEANDANSRRVVFGDSRPGSIRSSHSQRRRTSSTASSPDLTRRPANAPGADDPRRKSTASFSPPARSTSIAAGSGVTPIGTSHERQGSAASRRSLPSSPLSSQPLTLDGEDGKGNAIGLSIGKSSPPKSPPSDKSSPPSIPTSASLAKIIQDPALVGKTSTTSLNGFSNKRTPAPYREDSSDSDSEVESLPDEEDVMAPPPEKEAKSASVSSRRKDVRSKVAKLTAEDVRITEDELNQDLEEIWVAMHMFMNSRMIEAEDICLKKADSRLYYSVGYTLIQCIKSLMSFEPGDLEAAIQCCTDSLTFAQLLRKKDGSMYESVGRFIRGSAGISTIKSMSVVERHAELIYAECLMLRAVLGIIYSGDFIAFLKEAYNLRSAYAVYRALGKFVDTADAEARANGYDEDKTIDQNFKSGAMLGNGLISVLLALLPSKVLKVMEVFGFSGDREYGLTTLMRVGGWSFDSSVKEPAKAEGQEGIRRQICDAVLLVHHVVMSTYLPVGQVDIKLADNILHFNLRRYPDGCFFLYFAGRLYATQTLSDLSIKQFHKAIQSQREYIQLQHICHWDLSLTYLSLGQFKRAYECFNILFKESNWSKAIYAYAKAVSLYEDDNDSAEAKAIMKTVPDLMQRIAGKSIPLEKFVARKARKFERQGGRLLLPGVELAYVLNALGMAPRFALFDVHLDRISSQIGKMHKVKDVSAWGVNGDEFWDDYCLAHLLRGIVLRLMAHPEAHIAARPAKCQIPVEEANTQAMISFNNVLKHGRDLQTDHFLVWFTHYEIGRLYFNQGDIAKGKQHLNQVMEGKNMEINASKKGKGKVSLQNMAVLRSNAALAALTESK